MSLAIPRMIPAIHVGCRIASPGVLQRPSRKKSRRRSLSAAEERKSGDAEQAGDGRLGEITNRRPNLERSIGGRFYNAVFNPRRRITIARRACHEVEEDV